MDTSPQTTEQRRCPICCAVVPPGLRTCGACGSAIGESPAHEIRSVNYLLSELDRWESDGIVLPQTALEMRESYVRRRDELRAKLAPHGAPARSDPLSPEPATESPRRGRRRRRRASAPKATSAADRKRSFLETLADPRTIRLLLYVGAAMLVVGVVIWLRDVLYLKLQDPVVQAALLAIGTLVVTVSGWLIILRTRLLLSGRALTLVGSILVPVNFWFLVRSGLIDDNGRAWLVCALCASLYAITAAVLRDKLYVYLACMAAVGTCWAVIYNVEREAFAPYALSSMGAALIFLHLARVFHKRDDSRAMIEAETQDHASPKSAIRNPQSTLWGRPLLHMALVAAAISALAYMPLRLLSSHSFRDGILRLRASDYDPGVAALLFSTGAYIAWFTGRYLSTRHRPVFYTVTALALFWIQFLLLDGFMVPGPVELLTLAATALIAMLAAQKVRGRSFAISLRLAGLIVSVVVAALLYPVLSAAQPYPFTHGVILVLLATTYASSGEPRFPEKSKRDMSAHAAIAFATAGLLVVQAIIYLHAGDPSLLTPFVTLGSFGLLLLCAGIWYAGRSRVQSFRVGLYSLVHAFVLACLHSGFDPLGDIETYTTPVAVLMLVAAYLAARRAADDFTADTSLLLWTGSILLCAPLLVHALQYRLLLDVPAPWRDLATLGASLALILYGVAGRLRAPVIVGSVSMALELVALALTSVSWLQIPLKFYLMTAGSLILLTWGLLEFRHEQIVRVRQRLSERRENVRERFENLK